MSLFRYDSPVAVYYAEAEATERNFNWLPEDDYLDCRFGLAGPSKSLIDQLIKLLRAPWMDKTENLLVKINRVLDSLHRLFDWREPAKCKAVALGLVASSALHLWLPFSKFLFLVNGFLFLLWTPVWAWCLTYLPLPFALRKRLSHLAAAKEGRLLRCRHRLKFDGDDDSSGDDDDEHGGQHGGSYGGARGKRHKERKGLGAIGHGTAPGSALDSAPNDHASGAPGGDVSELGAFLEGATDGGGLKVHPLLLRLLPNAGTMRRIRALEIERQRKAATPRTGMGRLISFGESRK